MRKILIISEIFLLALLLSVLLSCAAKRVGQNTASFGSFPNYNEAYGIEKTEIDLSDDPCLHVASLIHDGWIISCPVIDETGKRTGETVYFLYDLGEKIPVFGEN